MKDVNVGVIGLGNVGSGTVTILDENADQIALKLGFRLKVTAVAALELTGPVMEHVPADALRTKSWREVVDNPNVDIVVELVGGTTVAREIIDAAVEHGKSVVTANKELMALSGCEIWDRAIRAGINLAMEASVCGGIPIHAVLREGISGDRITALYGILNGTSNFILTEMEKRGDSFETVLAEAQRAGLRGSQSERGCGWVMTRARSWRFCRRWRSASISRQPTFTWRGSGGSRRWIFNMPTRSTTLSVCCARRDRPPRD